MPIIIRTKTTPLLTPAFGVTPEIGISVSNLRVRYFPEVDQKFAGQTGDTVVRVLSSKFSRTIECEGEITGTTGVMAFLIGTALTFANSVSTFTPVAGSIYLDEATVTRARGAWRTVSIKASSLATL